MSIMLQRIAHSSFDLGEVARGVQANIIRMNNASVGYPLFIAWRRRSLGAATPLTSMYEQCTSVFVPYLNKHVRA